MPEDKENQKVNLKTNEKGQSTLPNFVSYDESTRTYQIKTGKKTKPGNYLIYVSLSDTFSAEKIYSFTIKVMTEEDSLQTIIPNT